MTLYTATRPANAVEGIHKVEHFLATNDLVTDNNIGEFGWELQTIGNPSTITYLDPAAGDIPGGLKIITNATADGDGCALQTDDDGVNFKASDGGGGFAFLARIPSGDSGQLAGCNFRIGAHSSITATEPTDGIWVDCAAGVISVDAASADHGDKTGAAASVSTLTSGTTMVLNTWHLFECQWSGENGQGGPSLVELFVDGEPAVSIDCLIDDDETAELKVLHWQDTGSGAAIPFQIKFFEYWQHYALPVATAV